MQERVTVGSTPDEDGRDALGPEPVSSRAWPTPGLSRSLRWALGVEDVPMLATVKWRNCLQLSLKLLLFKLFLDQNLSGWSLGSGVGVLESSLPRAPGGWTGSLPSLARAQLARANV